MRLQKEAYLALYSLALKGAGYGMDFKFLFKMKKLQSLDAFIAMDKQSICKVKGGGTTGLISALDGTSLKSKSHQTFGKCGCPPTTDDDGFDTVED